MWAITAVITEAAKAMFATAGAVVLGRVVGGAQTVQECLAEGLVDEVRLHVAAVLLGGGTPLFGGSLPAAVELEQIDAVSTALATHLTFRVR